MKLSVSSKLNVLYKTLGVKRGASLEDSFPNVLIQDYFEPWLKFVKTQVVRDLMEDKTYGKIRAASAFVSYISSIDTRCWAEYSVNMNEINSLSVARQYQLIRQYMNKKGFNGLQKFREHREATFSDVDFIRAGIDIVYSGYCVYTPRGRTTLEQFIQSLVPTTFKDFPIELTKTPKLSTLLASSLMWLPVLNEDGVSLSIGRASMNQLVFKYTIKPKNAIIFYGKNKPDYVQKYINKFKETL